MKKLLAVLLMVVVVLFISCDKDDDDSSTPSIKGKWYLYQIIDTYDYDSKYTEEWTYDIGSDIDYMGTQLYEITSDMITMYEYDSDEPGNCYTWSMSYELDGNNLIIDESNYNKLEYSEIVKFHFEGSMLVVVSSYENDYYSASHTQKFKPYSGELPPASWEAGVSDDQYEPDDSYVMATAITLGSSQTHITTIGDEDWFSFNGVMDETYLIKVSANSVDNYLYLYDTDGYTLLDSDDDNDDDVPVVTINGLNPVLLWDCPVTGTYYFSVTGYDEYDEGVYSVEINTSDLTITKNDSKESIKKTEKTVRFPFLLNK